jgi:hypothetical protein
MCEVQKVVCARTIYEISLLYEVYCMFNPIQILLKIWQQYWEFYRNTRMYIFASISSFIARLTRYLSRRKTSGNKVAVIN